MGQGDGEPVEAVAQEPVKPLLGRGRKKRVGAPHLSESVLVPL